MLRIGHINYANCTPIFTAMHELFPSDGYQFVSGVPAKLNSMLASGDIDLCPSSSIAFSMLPDKLLIMPDLSISSFGPVQSVLMFSKKAIDKLDGCTVMLSAESATSVNLLKILLKKRFAVNCFFQSTPITSVEALNSADALLLTGDAALKTAQTVNDLYVYDLGELWYDWTGTPFVFALWLASREAFQRNAEEFLTISDRFVTAKQHAMANLDKIADQAQERFWMGRELLLEYWKVLSYDLSGQHIDGLNLFYRYAAELGLIAAAPELKFMR